MTSIDLNEILAEREKTHGSFEEHARITYALKTTIRNTKNWNQLHSDQKEALDMVAHKIGRILAGNPNEPDHWDDTAGYSKLVADRLHRDFGTEQ